MLVIEIIAVLNDVVVLAEWVKYTLLVPGLPDVVSALTHGAVSGMDRFHDSVEVIIIESLLKPDGTFKLVLSTVMEAIGGAGGAGGAGISAGLLQANIKIIGIESKRTRLRNIFIITGLFSQTDYENEEQ